MFEAQHNRRRHRRLPVRLPATLAGQREISAMAMVENVSYTGVFVQTDKCFELREFVQLQLEQPDTLEIVCLLALVTRVITPEQAARANQQPGIGLRLYGLSHELSHQWKAFVDRMLRTYDMQCMDGPKQPDLSSSQSDFIVYFQDVMDMYSMLTIDFEVGGLFLKTKQLLEEEDPIRLLLVHPENKAKFFISGRVIEVHPHHAELDSHGMLIAFDNVTSKRLVLFKRFVESGLPKLDTPDFLSLRSCDGMTIMDDGPPSFEWVA